MTPFATGRIGFVIKHHHPRAKSLALELAAFLVGRKKKVVFAAESRAVAQAFSRSLPVASRKLCRVVPKERLPHECDFVVVLGGDGTLLSIARLMRERSVPILGINMGTLGFLTEINHRQARVTLGAILEGKKVKVQERALLQVRLQRGKKTIYEGPVVNDAVISKGAIARIIGLQVSVDGTAVNHIRADGLIVSTPTGSTAYSLAAGGPIVEPTLKALVVTPICPHSLTQRPIVISDSSTLEVILNQRPGHVLLTLDGQDAIDLKQGDRVIVRRFTKHALRLISSPGRDYFSVLREKLSFGNQDVVPL